MKQTLRIIILVIVATVVVMGLLWLRDRQQPRNQTQPSQNTNDNIPAGNNANDSGLTQAYQNSRLGFSIRYPDGYKVDSYEYQNPGTGPDIEGVKFIIPENLRAGTNLAPDSNVGVEFLRDAPFCTANLFMTDNASVAQSFSDNGATYSRAEFIGAAAGNRYDETVFAFPGTNPCIAVHYTIHSTAIENYPPGTIQEFDKQALLVQFDQIRRSLMINQ